MKWTDWITFALASTGAVLGIINTFVGWRDRRPRLRVTPSWAFTDQFTGLSIEVANVGAVAVTVNELGFLLGESRNPLPKRMVIPDTRIAHGSQGPLPLGPHESASITFDANDLETYAITSAYARTATGLIFRGTSDALKQFISRGNRFI